MVAKENPFLTYCGVSFLRITSFTFLLPLILSINRRVRNIGSLSKWGYKEKWPKRKNRKRSKQDGDKQSMRGRVQNTGYQGVQGI